MSGKHLHAEYERLVRRIADALANKQEASSEAWDLLQGLRSLTEQYAEKLADAKAQIAELKRELFGPKADWLSAEQQDQLKNIADDLKAEAERTVPASDEVLSEDAPPTRKQRKQTPRRRHPMPAHLETETVTIEPDLGPCPCCGKIPNRIGEKVTEEIEFNQFANTDSQPSSLILAVSSETSSVGV